VKLGIVKLGIVKLGIVKLAGYTDRTISRRLRVEPIKECNLATEQLRKLRAFES